MVVVYAETDDDVQMCVEINSLVDTSPLSKYTFCYRIASEVS